MKGFYKIIFISAFFGITLFCNGQTEKFQFTKIGVEDGLGHSHVFSITQDSKGYIWFGTMYGLSKYNGKEFINYRYNASDSTSISSNWVYGFFEDSKGRFYVATNNGFNKFNRELGSFERFYHIKDNAESLSSNNVRDILETNDGKIVLATGIGVDFFDPTTNKFEHFTHPKFGYERHSPRLYKDHNNDFWAAGINGIYKVNEKENKLDYFPLINEEGNPILVRRIVQDSSYNYWLATDDGLFIFYLNEGKFEHVPISDKLIKPDVKALILGDNNTFYIGSGLGLVHWDVKLRKPIIHHAYSSNNPGGITVDNIYSLMRDNQDNIWIGMFRNADILSKSSEKFKVFYNEYGLNNLSNTILDIIVDSKKRVWTSTITGIYLKDNIQLVSRHFSGVNTAYEDLTSVRDFEEDKEGDIWFTIQRKGLYKTINQSEEIVEVETSQFFKGNYLEEFLFDKENSSIVWLATLGGLCRYNMVTKDTFWVYPSILDTTLANDKLSILDQQANGTLWFTNSRRLCSYNPQTNKLKAYKTDEQDATAWSSGVAYNLVADVDRIYLSGSDFSYFDINKERFVNYTNENYPKITGATAVLLANDGNVWMAGGSNVRAYNPQTDSFVFYNLNKETKGFITGSRFKGKNGKLYFGGSDGLLVINPEIEDFDTNKVAIVLSKFSVSYKEKKFDKAIEYIKKIKLQPKETVFEIEYTALNYTNQDNLTYRYKLIGFNEEWVDVENRRTVTFTNLFPGNYTFLAEATNENGFKVTDTLELEIVVTPPFWKTNWFYASIVGIIFLIMYLIFLNWKRTEKLKQERQLADQKALYKTKFLTNMSHELRTPMNAIMGLNTLMLGSELNEKQKEYTKAIHLSCENLLWIINDILDQAKIESGKLKIKSEPFNIKAVIDQVKLLLINKIQEKDIQFILKLDETIPESVIGDPIRIFQVLTNLIGNAIKFTEEGSITVSVTQQETKNETANLLFEVEDTGIGIQKDQLESIFKSFEQVGSTKTKNFGNQGTGLGLSIAKELVELMGGEIKVESEFNQGSKFYFTLPFQIAKETLKNEKTEQQYIPEGLKILLVEDTPMNQFVAVELLQKHLKNPIIEKANNGKEALDKIENKSYDLVLMDIKMPIMDGLEATQLIRAKGENYYKNIPILGLTANAIPQQIEACFNAGMNECVTKPINIDELTNKISAVMSKKNLL
ncbi:MAG: ATP-binding protein [Chitinophagales bacterium]